MRASPRVRLLAPRLDSILLEKRVVVGVARAGRRLAKRRKRSKSVTVSEAFHMIGRHVLAVDVGAPPRAASPPEGTSPHIRVGLEVVKEASDGSLAGRVGATGELADDAELAVGAEPVGGSGNALGANGGADADIAGARSIGVEVLVHLVDDLVLGVGQGNQVSVDRGPGPGTRVRVALDEDVLRGGARATDGGDGGLVEVEDEGLVHIVVLVVGVEDDTRVGRELGGEFGPEAAEGARVGDDVAVVAAKVVGVQDGVRASVRDEVDRLGQVLEVGGVEGRCQLVRSQALHGEGHAENIEAVVDVGLSSQC